MIKIIWRAVVLIGVLMLAPNAIATTVTRSPSSCANVGSGADWSNMSNAYSSNNSYATVELDDWETSEYLQCTNYGFSIPVGSSISGITVSIERRSSDSTTHQDESLKIVKGGAQTGTEMANTSLYYPTSDGIATYGGSSAQWGTSWSASDINAGNFGVGLSVVKKTSSGGNRTASVDHIAITVDYTAAPSSPSAILVAQYRVEETSWNGASGELKDTAAYASGPYNGRAYKSSSTSATYPTASSSSPALSSDPGTCGYAALSGRNYFRVDSLNSVSTTSGQTNSVGFWLYWNGASSQTALHWSNGYGLVFHNGKFGFTTYNWSGSSYDVNGVSTSGLSGGWHHVAAVFVNGAPASNKLYIDGVLKTLTQSGSTSSSYDQVGTTLYMGVNNRTSGGWYLSGRLDEVKVYTGELSQAEVTALHAETHACSGGCGSVTGTSSISFVAANAPSSVSASTVASLSFGKPSGTATNDVLVAQVAAYRAGSTNCTSITAPTGWTLARTEVASTSSSMSSSTACTRQSLYYKVAGASEPGSYSFSFANSVYATGSLAAYRGADTAAPVMTSSGKTSSGTGNITAPSVTTTRAGAMLLGAFSVRDGSDETIIPPACMSERVQSATGSSSGITLSLADSPWGTASATGSRVASVDDSDVNIGQLLVLQPPVAVLTPSAYNAFDSTTAAGSINGKIQTKMAGTAFTSAIVALNAGRTALYGSSGSGFAGTLKVELLGNTGITTALDANNCPTSSTGLHSGTLTFVAGDNSRKNYAFPAVSEAWRDVRVRVSYPATGTATTIGCSTDNFAIRPASFASVGARDANWTTNGATRTLNNTAASGGVVHAAGEPFTLTATAVNSANVTTTQYSGSPNVTLTACPLPAGCAVDGSGSFSPGTFSPGAWASASGVITSTDANYSDAGTLTLQLVDDSFAAVDASDGSASDCSGRYICSAASTIGRFVPDHFELSLNDPDEVPYPTPQLQTFGGACANTRSFTYIGQSFGYLTPPRVRVLAMDANGNVTRNYQRFDASPSPVVVAQNYSATTPASPALNVSAIGTPTLLSNGDGTAELTLSSSGTLQFTRGGPEAPFNAAINLSLGVSDASEAATSGNGTIATTNTADFAPIAFDSGDEFRYGRLRISNAAGSELLPLPVSLTAQYWNGSGFVTNSPDNCTALSAPALTFFTGVNSPLASGDTSASYNNPLLAGIGGLRLSAPLSHHVGYLDITLTAPAWLQYNWDGVDQGGDGNLFDDNPRARAAFGKRKGSEKVIIRREIY